MRCRQQFSGLWVLEIGATRVVEWPRSARRTKAIGAVERRWFFTENLSSRWSSHSLIRAAIRHLPINKRNHFSIGARFRLRKSVMSSSSSVALWEKLKKAPTDCKTKPREEKGRVSTIDHPSSCFKLFRVFCFFYFLFFKKKGGGAWSSFFKKEYHRVHSETWLDCISIFLFLFLHLGKTKPISIIAITPARNKHAEMRI